MIVSDTSPIRAFANLGRLDLLQQLFIDAYIPPAVASELARAPRGQTPVIVDTLPFVRVRPPTDRLSVERFRRELDPGESEALALALELKADRILIDEAAGRNAASRVGLTPIGVVGILLEAKQRGLLNSVAPLLDRLQEFRFFLTPQVRAAVLRMAGEFP